MHRTHLNIVATVETIIGRMPANVEAERSILGAILFDNHAYNDAAEHLKPEDFSIDAHRRVYSRMMDLSESALPIARRVFLTPPQAVLHLHTIYTASLVFPIARPRRGSAFFRRHV